MSISSPPFATPCPRCGRVSDRVFDATGVCTRCAGAGIFALTVSGQPGSVPPFAADENASGPAQIGPYTIIGEIGRGGMGVVYLAQHIQLGRTIALKVIPCAASATSDLEMRFLREARTAARLNHPHIVAVHDAGRDQGHAYFAMDYFEDGDLARRLRAQPFSPREAAELIRSVAEAIAFSHAAGILHRDLKPSNILLVGGTPHIADFGLAAELDGDSGLTARSAVLGTPHYLSPEALSRGPEAQAAAADIYALGVILHEMLTGRTPFAGASPAELPGLLLRREAPALHLLAPQVPRDLATICTKCLEFDPSHRYATAADLAEDLRRFLAGEPIRARPISAVSQLLRWARRRPALAAAWTLSFLLAGASLTAAVWIERERQRADRAAATSKVLAEFLRKDLLEQASPSGEPDRELRLRTVLDRAAEKIPARFASAPLAEADLRFTLGTTYFSLGEYEQAEGHLRRAREVRRTLLGEENPETLRAAIELANTLNSRGKLSEASALVHPAIAGLARQLGETAPDTINAREIETEIERSLGHASSAEMMAREVLAIARHALGDEHELTRNALVNLTTLLESQGKPAEALPLMRELVTLSEHALGAHHPQTLGTRVSLAALDGQLGRSTEAEASLRQLHAMLVQQLGADHPETLRALSNLGTVLSRSEKAAEADTVFTELVATRRRVLGPEHPITLVTMKSLAIARGRNGHLDEAITLMREIADTNARVLGPTHANTLVALRTIAAMSLTARRFDDALPPARTAYLASLDTLGPDDPATLADTEVYASALGLSGRLADSEPLWRAYVAGFARTQPDSWKLAFGRGQLGRTLALLNRPAEAEPLLREGYTVLLARQAELPAIRKKLPALYAEQLVTVYTALGRTNDAAAWRAKTGTP